MVKKLKIGQLIAVASLLFGMLFGAGNLIFPIHLGQIAGSNFSIASFGFIITAVGVPLLGIVSLAASNSNDMHMLAKPVGNIYSLLYTITLYLTIGPFFAIPRCATTAYTIGIVPLVGKFDNEWTLMLFVLLFFVVCVYFSFNDSKILTSIGKIINPLFLIFFGILLICSVVKPIGLTNNILPDENYISKTYALTKGFIEGYQTLDAIACLAFGVVVIDVIKSLGVNDDKSISSNLIMSGVICAVLMAVIYFLSTRMGAQSRNAFSTSANGGIALAQVSDYYFGTAGKIILALIVIFATLKTSIGLITSISDMFSKLFPKFLNKRKWIILFTVFSNCIANVGLTTIINFAVPVLMFLYPLTITIIFLGIFGKYFKYDHKVYKAVTIGAFIPAVVDMLNALPKEVIDMINANGIIAFSGKAFPLFDVGLSWFVPSLIGLVIGLILHFAIKDK